MTIIELKEWQNNLKVGDMVVYQRYMSSIKEGFVEKSSPNNIWVSFDDSDQIGVIKWNDIIEIYTQEKNPEYFL